MSVIQIIDKQFKPFLSIQEIDTAVSNIANKINQEFAHQKVLFVSILNGSFMFTSDLMKKITRLVD